MLMSSLSRFLISYMLTHVPRSASYIFSYIYKSLLAHFLIPCALIPVSRTHIHILMRIMPFWLYFGSHMDRYIDVMPTTVARDLMHMSIYDNLNVIPLSVCMYQYTH